MVSLIKSKTQQLYIFYCFVSVFFFLLSLLLFRDDNAGWSGSFRPVSYLVRKIQIGIFNVSWKFCPVLH